MSEFAASALPHDLPHDLLSGALEAPAASPSDATAPPDADGGGEAKRPRRRAQPSRRTAAPATLSDTAPAAAGTASVADAEPGEHASGIGEPRMPNALARRAAAERHDADAELPDGLAPLVELLVTRAHDPETIRELLDIQREYRAERAREAYSEALARFRGVAPTLEKDRTVHFEARDKGKGATHYRHTSIGYTMGVVNPLLGSLGLNLSWHPHVEDGVIHVETRLTHALGHSESVTLPGAPDTSGNKNAIQAMKSTITYLERCGAFALLGLASTDDDDGAAAVPPPEPEGGFATFEQAEDLSNLLDLIETLDPGYRGRFVAHYSGRYAPGDNPLGLDLPRARLERTTHMLKRKLADARTSAAARARESAGLPGEPSGGAPTLVGSVSGAPEPAAAEASA